jgi:hypothetical protein
VVEDRFCRCNILVSGAYPNGKKTFFTVLIGTILLPCKPLEITIVSMCHGGILCSIDAMVRVFGGSVYLEVNILHCKSTVSLCGK